MNKETLILRFPKSMQNRVRSVLGYIQPHVTWDDKGEVSIQDRDILGINIVDLLKVHLKDYKEIFFRSGKTHFEGCYVSSMCQQACWHPVLDSSQEGVTYLHPRACQRNDQKTQSRKSQMASPMKYEDYLASIYFDPIHVGPYGGVEKMCRAVQKDGKFVLSRTKIHNWLLKQ